MNKTKNMLFFVRSCHGSYGKQELVKDAERWHSSKLSMKTVLAAFKSAHDQNKFRAKEQIAVIVEIKQNKNFNSSYSS